MASPVDNDLFMDPFHTRSTLLVRIRNPDDHASWVEFVDLYMPLLHAYAYKLGFQDADSADAAQETLLRVAQAISTENYQREKGTFRGWLFTIHRNTLRLLATKSKRQPAGTGDTDMVRLLQEQPDREQLDLWDTEYRTRLFHWAAQKTKPWFQATTWDAFWRTSVENQSVTTVANDLGLSVGAVYIARSRVLSKIREEIQIAESWYDQPETR
jgi:RNA polymerase sigma-70 factor (ECF subfamily)